MNICVVYYSKFGNNGIIAEYIGKKFREKDHTATVNSNREVEPDALPKADLYVFCSPSAMGNAAGKMNKFLTKAVFENADASYTISATYMLEGSKTLETLTDVLEKKAIKKASPGLELKVDTVKGPLEEGYEKKLDSLVEELVG